MTTTVDLTLEIKSIDPDEALAIWKRLNLIAEGFLLDGRDVEVSTWTYNAGDDDDSVDTASGSPEDGAQR